MSTRKNQNSIETKLKARLSEQRYRVRVVPIDRLRDLGETFQETLNRGWVDPGIIQCEIEDFVFEPPPSLPQAKSVIVVAAPQSEYRVTFNWKRKLVTCAIPPTYPHAKKTREKLARLLGKDLAPNRVVLDAPNLPEKLLAVCSGLADYGRNNIAYVEGMGSSFRPFLYFSDLDAADDEWQAPTMMEACSNCSACSRRCPVDAIPDDRFVLHAERCITFHNEKDGRTPFPAWIDSAWHNSLVGCMDCQRVCPVNRKNPPDIQKGPDFTETETAEILDKTPVERLSEQTLRKLERSDLVRFLDLLPRNLGALLSL